MPSRVWLIERGLPVAVLALSAISVPVMMLAPTGIPRLHALEQEKARVDLEVSRLGDQIRKLRAEVRRLKEDPARVEQAARDELGLSRQSELVFRFDG